MVELSRMSICALITFCIRAAFLKPLRRQRKMTRAALSESWKNDRPNEITGWNEENKKLFIQRYWQKYPLLIRSAVPLASCDIKKSELFQLSSDDDVESRLLIRQREKYLKEYGPFDDRVFQSLPTRDWTLLVQEVDRHIPRIADIWKHFSFIPSWRRDDIMISYATVGGGIGAHVDNYDVFLIQGRGKREWSIEFAFLTAEEEKEREVAGSSTRLLRDFRSDLVWTLEAGDMLYLPPRVPHRGISLGGDCTTISLGFRAPSYSSMVTALCENVCAVAAPATQFYTDPDPAWAPPPSQVNDKNKAVVPDSDRNCAISSVDKKQSTAHIPRAIRQRIAVELKAKILSVLDDKEKFDSWLGMYLTSPLRMRVRKNRPFFIRCVMIDSYHSDPEELDDFSDELPLSVSGPNKIAANKIYDSAADVIRAVTNSEINLRLAEGLKVAHTETKLFIEGEMFPLPNEFPGSGWLFCGTVDKGGDSTISAADLAAFNVGLDGNLSSPIVSFLSTLLERGFYYPVNAS